MKKLLLLLLTIVSLQAKAQFINLPDSNLRNALIVLYPSYFNAAKQLDTISASYTSGVLRLASNSIINATGIHYFKKCDIVILSNNPITVLPKLPDSCIELNLVNCGVGNTGLSFNSFLKLKTLNISYNNLNVLPLLPPNLLALNCNNNILTQLPNLPIGLISLVASDNNLRQILNLPSFLKNLDINNNLLDSLPVLPSSLTMLNCDNNSLKYLPPLPNALQYLYCNFNDLTGLPALPNALQGLFTTNNKLSQLPNLPNALRFLHVNNNQLTQLPALPILLYELYCQKNKLSQISILSSQVSDLDCNNNLITSLIFSSTDSTLTKLNCDSNLISNINYLPKNLNTIRCKSNLLTNLPSLPSSLNEFDCSNNPIIGLDSVSLNKIRYFGSLDISKTLIKRLPTKKISFNYFDASKSTLSALPDSLGFTYLKLNSCPINQFSSYVSNIGGSFIELDSTNFSDFSFLSKIKFLNSASLNYTSINKLPILSSLQFLSIHETPNLNCLPILRSLQFLYADSSKISCLPYIRSNSLSAYNTEKFNSTTLHYDTLKIQVCNPTNNISSCSNFPAVLGSVFVDENSNGIKDASETFKPNIAVRLSNINRTVTNLLGNFLIFADSIGSQTLTVTAPRFYTAIPTTQTFNFNKYDTLVNLPPIALQKIISKDSLAIKITPINWAARPGFPYPFLVQYENVGSNTVNANINLTYNTTALDYDSSSTTVTPTVGNLQLVRNSFTPGSQGAFVSYFKVKPSASLLGINLKTWASISGGSALATDTTIRVIGGSYDPNDKLATPQLTTTQVAEGQFINYTIRFQNTGTDTAFTVVIADTLNSLLQANTFEMLGSSHNCKTIIQDNKIYFEFRNILLPDSTTNLIGSNGFVNFRTKPISSVALNTSIPNKAAIYFDYNEPIITNTASTLISNTVLPLQLVRFNVLFKQGSGVLFNWETKNEQAVKEFVVEESKDAINFKALQQTKSKGNGDNNYFSNANYAATEMVGTKYYRLKNLSNNGNIAYSQIVKLNFDKSVQPFIILQNPVKGSLQIQVNAQSLNNTEALLINQEGKVVQGFKLQLGSQTIGLNKLVAGMYTLKTVEGSKNLLVN